MECDGNDASLALLMILKTGFEDFVTFNASEVTRRYVQTNLRLLKLSLIVEDIGGLAGIYKSSTNGKSALFTILKTGFRLI